MRDTAKVIMGNKLKKGEWINGYNLLWNILFCCLVVIGLSQCVMPYDPGRMVSSEGLLVVDAYIIAPTGSNIKISRTKDLHEEGDYEKVSNAQVKVVDDQGNIVAVAGERVTGTGEYVVEDPIAFVAGTKYALDIVIGGEHFQSAFEEPLTTPEIDELSWVTKEDGYELDILLNTHDPLQQAEYYLWRYDEEWEYTARIFVGYRWDPVRREVVPYRPEDNMYYCWDKSSYTSLIFEDVRTLQDGVLKDKVMVSHKAGGTRFSYLYSILVRQYAIPYEAYKYYENMQKNVSSAGGLFAPMPTEIDGNIVNLTNPGKAVIGYVLIAAETSKRMYIDVMDVPRMREELSERCMTGVSGYSTNPEGAYNNGWGVNEFLDEVYTYRRMECVDCVVLGGSKKKPAYWPTNHL